MHIVHISDCYAPRIGGIESQVRDLARHQVAAGHEVHLLTATPSDGPERNPASEIDDGVFVHRLSAKMPTDFPANPRQASLIRAKLRELRPDVVHVQAGVVSLFAFDGLREANRLSLPIVVTWHCMLDGVIPVVKWGARLTGWDKTRFVATAVSQAAADQVVEVFPGREVLITPNGLDLAAWKPADCAADGAVADDGVVATESGGPLRVVATMRLAPRKRVFPLVLLVNRARELAREIDPSAEIELSIVGSGPLESALRAMVATPELQDWVTVVGRVPREELAEIYSSSDVFVAPAVKESFGIAALEARASGLAILGRAGTGLAEFVADEVDGMLADSDEAAAALLAQWATSRDALSAIRRHNVAVPPTQNWDHAMLAIQVAYDQAVADRKTARHAARR